MWDNPHCSLVKAGRLLFQHILVAVGALYPIVDWLGLQSAISCQIQLW